MSDLSPLKGMPLKGLNCHDTPVHDLLPLQDCNSLCRLDRQRHQSHPRLRRRPAKSPSLTAKLIGTIRPNQPPLQQNQPWNTPAFQKWVKEVQAMPAEDQIKAVSSKLVELNPGFDGKVTDWNRNLPPRSREAWSRNLGSFPIILVTDISPVRVLQQLKVLICSGSSSSINAKLFDLSPLRGMLLTRLNCSDSQVSDISPLQEMPLTWLATGNTKVSDLTPLKGMRLTTLWCSTTPVSDISSLTNMRDLAELALFRTKVTSDDVESLQKSLPNCKIEWPSRGRLYRQPAKVTNINSPVFQQWMKEVQAMPAEEQIKAVSKKLMELNPGFDGKVTDLTMEEACLPSITVWSGMSDLPPTT